MNRIIVGCVFLSIFLAVGCGQKEEVSMTMPSPDLQSLIDAEHNFADQVPEKGLRGAFLANLDENSVIFNPQPINGQMSYEEREDKPALLEWEPIFADISRAGRMGYTTGPWQFRADSTDPEPSVFGDYVSIWKRPPGGAWKVVVDIGIFHTSPDTSEHQLTWPMQPTDKKAQVVVDYEAAQNALMEVDRKLSETSMEQGYIEALVSAAADDFRVYRNGSLPTVGKEAARNLLSDVSGVLTWEPEAGSLARSGDLGYTYGTAILRPSADIPEIRASYSYLRIWKKGDDNHWQVVLDIALELPKTKDEGK